MSPSIKKNSNNIRLWGLYKKRRLRPTKINLKTLKMPSLKKCLKNKKPLPNTKRNVKLILKPSNLNFSISKNKKNNSK